MSFLLRTRVGIFEINTASLLEDISIDAFKYILPYDIAINHLPKIIIPSKQISKFCNGVSVILDTDITNVCRVYDLNNNFLGVGISDRKTVKPHKVFTGI